VNFVGFSVIHVSQGSVVTYVRCGGMPTYRCIANFLLSLSVEEFLKSVKIWRSYCQSLGGLVFLEHRVYNRCQTKHIQLISWPFLHSPRFGLWTSRSLWVL